MALTDPTCKNAKCPEGKPRQRYADSGGLYLEVVPSGGRHWYWKYRFGGKERRLAIGSYPTVGLAKAREARDAARKALREGNDPVQLKRDAMRAKVANADHSFEAVARTWYAHWAGARSGRHADYVLRRLEADVFPAIGGKAIATVTAHDLVRMARRIEERGTNETARRAWQTCGQVFEYAATLENADGKPLVDRNPSKDVRPGAALKARKTTNFARLDAKDLPELLRKIDGYNGSIYTRIGLKLMAYTFVRTGELTAAHWDEFDLDAAEWRISAERMKMKRLHIVPLSTQAVDLLRGLQEIRGLSGLLFPNERDHEKPMSSGAMLGALKRLGYNGRMTGHGFRGIASTILHEHGSLHGFDHAHIELQLAHQERNKISAAYNHAQYLPQRRVMMQWYADHLDALRQGAKVLPFKAA